MASIHGISIKNLMAFPDHEDMTIYRGDLYFGEERLGHWGMDYWNGPDNFDFENQKLEELLNMKIEELNPDKTKRGTFYNGKEYSIPYDLTRLLYDLVKLTHDEQNFNKFCEKGNVGTMVVTDGYHKVTFGLNKRAYVLSDEELLERFSKDIENAKTEAKFLKETEDTKHVVKFYRTLEDFHIGEKVDLKELLKEESLEKKISAAQNEMQVGDKKVANQRDLEK